MRNPNTILSLCLTTLLTAGCSLLMEPDPVKPSTNGSAGADGEGTGGKGATSSGGSTSNAGATNVARAGSSQSSPGGSGGIGAAGATAMPVGGTAGASGSTGGGTSTGIAVAGTAGQLPSGGTGAIAGNGTNVLGTGGNTALGGAPGGGAATGGSSNSGVAGSAGSCNTEGCPCVASATQCGSSTTLQTCGSDGKWVSANCANLDTAHCTVSCVTGTSSASCVVAAADADADTYGTKACAAAPGTDCDDSLATVHPGATEICDGIDNDCNGLADLKDGLALSGTAQVQTGHSQIDLAWSPTMLRFAMVSMWTSPGIYFGGLGTTGTTTWSSSPVVPSTGGHSNPKIEWVPSFAKFAYAHAWGGMAGSGSSFNLVSDLGVPDAVWYSIGPGNVDNGVIEASMAVRAAGDLLLVAHDGSNVYLSRCLGYGSTVVATISGEVAMHTRLATAGDLSAFVYQINGTNTVNWVRVNASLVAGAPAQLTSAGQKPDIASVTNGYAMAWVTSTGFDYQVLNSADGSVVCGPTHVPFGNGMLETEDAIAIKATQYGVLALATDFGGQQVQLFRIDSGCSVTDQVPVRSTINGCYGPVIAVGGGYVGLTWNESGTSDYGGYVRVMGERLCN